MNRRNLPLFILEGNGTCANRGCEAILRSTLMILDKAFGSCRYINAPASGGGLDSGCIQHDNLVHLTSPQTPYGKVWHSIRKKLNPQYVHLAFQPYLKKARAMLVLGGDNLSLDYGVPDRQFYVINRALQAQVPVVIWGASIGPFTEQPNLEMYYLNCLRQVSLVCVRETLTKDYLARGGVSDNVVLVADPAFVLEAEVAQLPEELETALGTGAVGLNLSPLLARYQDQVIPWTQKAADLIRAVDQAMNSPIVLVPHVFKPNNNDHGFLMEAMKFLGKTRNPITLIGPNYNACQLKWIIGQLKLFIGARTHTTISALSSCVPTISIGYSVKARGINQDIFGHLDWLIPSQDLTPERLSEVVLRLGHQAVPVKDHLTSMMFDYQERSWNSGNLLKTVCK